jgi:hypothetical protein
MRQTRDRLGRVRGALLGGLVPTRDLEPAGLGISRGSARRSEPAASRSAFKKGANLIPLTEPEIRRLLLAIIWPRLTNIERALVWSDWRRHHQALARAAHYRRRIDAQL